MVVNLSIGFVGFAPLQYSIHHFIKFIPDAIVDHLSALTV